MGTLSYLVQSAARRCLLRLLWSDRKRGSVSELARQAGVSFASAHRELAAMERAGLACSEAVGNTVVFRANEAHEDAPVVRRLAALEAESGLRPNPPDEPVQREQQLRAWLAELGAPLSLASRGDGPPPPPERVLAESLRLAHKDPSVARALPVALWRQWERLQPQRLVAESRRVREKQTLGFFVDLTAALTGEPELSAWARQLQDRRVRRQRDFFERSSSPRQRALADQNTPALARRWHFRMNMPLDSFQTFFRKHVPCEPTPLRSS